MMRISFLKVYLFTIRLDYFLNSSQAVSTITITTRVLEEEEQAGLIDALNLVIKEIRGKEEGPSIPFIVTEENKDQFGSGDIVQEYEFKPKVDRSMDNAYIVKSYKSSFKLFKISFIGIYWLLSLGNGYLLYILASLLLYPLAKLPFDYWFGFRMDHMYSDPRTFGSFRYQRSVAILRMTLFQISIFAAPIGILFLLARKISSKSDSVNLPIKSAFKELKEEKLTMDRKDRNKSILTIVIGVYAISFNFLETLDFIGKYPGWIFSLFPLSILISQILAIRRIKVYEKKKKLSIFVHFFIGSIFLGLFLLIFLFSSDNDLSFYILLLLIALINFLSPFTSGLTEKGLYYKPFNIRSFFGYKPVYSKYKELSSFDFQMGGKEIKLLIHANILKSSSKKTMVFSLKDMTAINRMVSEFN